ncbi:MAG: chemotaxis protein CheW [Chromatiales bacterium]|nr:chemotaxis protein CheW [Chromatiales bacterium]
MSQTDSAEIRGVLLPVQDAQLLLPNATVNEVVGFQQPTSIENSSADWLLGTVEWRQQTVPVVAYELLLGLPVAESNHRARIAICNTLNGNADCPYIGIRLSSIPHLARIDQHTISPVDGEDADMVLRQVDVSGQVAWIPDLDALEQAVVQEQG